MVICCIRMHLPITWANWMLRIAPARWSSWLYELFMSTHETFMNNSLYVHLSCSWTKILKMLMNHFKEQFMKCLWTLFIHIKFLFCSWQTFMSNLWTFHDPANHNIIIKTPKSLHEYFMNFSWLWAFHEFWMIVASSEYFGIFMSILWTFDDQCDVFKDLLNIHLLFEHFFLF